MALFKIEKGLAANLGVNRPNAVEGYCYFTSDDGKFYIDIANGTAKTPAENNGVLAGSTRMPINAYLADKAAIAEWSARALADVNGNEIDSHYGNSLEITDKYNLKLFAHDANHTLLSTVTLPKDVDTASKFTSAQTIKLTGAVTGEKSSQAGWEIPTTLSDNAVTTSKISNGAVANEKLANSSITIGGKAVSLGGTLTLADIGLNTALRFIGTTSTAITDGSTTSSIVINGSSVTPTIGDVVINSNNNQEYVWLGDSWEILGDESSYALKDHTHDLVEAANRLKNARNIKTNLSSTEAASFDGTTDITPGVTGVLGIPNGGTGANTRKAAITNLGVFGLYDRDDIGTSPNFDNPGINGLFEMRSTSETAGETGTKPFNGFAPFISLRYSNTMFQLTGNNSNGFYVRGKQAKDPTLTEVAWQKFLTNANYSDYCAPKEHTHGYLPLSGGHMSGRIGTIYGTPASSIGNMYQSAAIKIRENNAVGNAQSDILYAPTLGFHWSGRVACNLSLHSDGALYLYNNGGNLSTFKAGSVYGAVWNDYAEFRICNEKFKPGQVVLENGDDTLSIASQRLQRGCSIVSDTFGFAIGETDEAKCPIAVSGRVLAYGYESREEFKKHIGWPVCSGPNGTVSIMTEEEEEKYPSRIIGTVSAVPDYETWGTGNIEVNNRIWIKIK